MTEKNDLNKLKSLIESLLFISSHPLSLSQLTRLVKNDQKEVEKALEELTEDYNKNQRGIKIIQNNNKFQMVTNPENSSLIQKFLKEERSGELTPASLETLSVLSYCGPMTKYELEQIRGVNCSLILRNLMIKGLVEVQSKNEEGLPLYDITFDFLHYLGLTRREELPDYEKLHRHQILEELINNQN